MKKILLTAAVLINLAFTGYCQSEPKFDKELLNALTYYYLNPQPSKVPAILQDVIASGFLKSTQASEGNVEYTAAYSFGRMAQMDPSLIEKYESIFESTTHEGRLFVLKILQVCGNDEVKKFLTAKAKSQGYEKEKNDIATTLQQGVPYKMDVINTEVKDPSELDFLWSEFLVSGDERAVKKIIKVFEWPDVTRTKLQAYLKSSTPVDQKKNIMQILTEEYDIQFDPASLSIASNNDLDIAVALYLQQQHGRVDSFQQIKDALGLSRDDIMHLATKGSAFWSLNSNARQHKKVFEICDGEIENSHGSAKIALLNIAIGKYLEEDTAKAADKLNQLIALNPTDALAHFSLGVIYLTNQDIKKAQAENDILKGLNHKFAAELNQRITYAGLEALDAAALSPQPGQIDYAQAAAKAKVAAERAQSYESKLYAKDFTVDKLKPHGFSSIEWSIAYEKPDKFSVEQISWEDNAADKWITIAKKSYFQVGAWFEAPADQAGGWDRNKTNRFLAQDKYVDVLKAGAPQSGAIYEKDNKKYIRLIYKIDETQLKAFHLPQGRLDGELEIWLDDDTGFIAKAYLKITGTNEKGQPINLAYEQLFTNYDASFNIEKPKEVINPSELQKMK